MSHPHSRKSEGPGVPEAVPRAVQNLGAHYGAEALDRLWIFPPMIKGRRERGLVTASRFRPEEQDERRVLITASYLGERTGKGLTFECSIDEAGIAPPDRLPRVMEGVVRRAGEELGDAREVEIGGDPAVFQELLESLGMELLDPALPPLYSEPEEVKAEATELERAGEAPTPAPPGASSQSGQVEDAWGFDATDAASPADAPGTNDSDASSAGRVPS